MKRIKSYSYLSGITLWSMLLLMRVYGVLPCEKISQISAQIGLCLHVFMLFTILKIFTRISRDQHKTLFWLFLINIGLFLNDLAFYWVIYLPKNYTLDLSFSSFVIDIIPYSLWNVSVLIFLTTLIKNIFSLKNFTTIFSFLLLIN